MILEIASVIGLVSVTAIVVFSCLPERDEWLWLMPQWLHRLIRRVTGYELAQVNFWSGAHQKYITSTEWRKPSPVPAGDVEHIS